MRAGGAADGAPGRAAVTAVSHPSWGNGRFSPFLGTSPVPRPSPKAAAGRPAQAAAASSLVQYLHLVAARGMSDDWQLGHVLVGGGSPKTALPRLFM